MPIAVYDFLIYVTFMSSNGVNIYILHKTQRQRLALI